VRNPKGKRPFARCRCRWEDNIKTDFQEVGWDMDWVDTARERDRWRALVNVIINLRFYKMLGIY
jgi:hypothetical protein